MEEKYNIIKTGVRNPKRKETKEKHIGKVHVCRYGESFDMVLLHGSNIGCTNISLRSSGLGLFEPAGPLPAVHQLETDSLEQLLQPSQVAHHVGSAVPLQHADEQLRDSASRR